MYGVVLPECMAKSAQSGCMSVIWDVWHTGVRTHHMVSTILYMCVHHDLIRFQFSMSLSMSASHDLYQLSDDETSASERDDARPHATQPHTTVTSHDTSHDMHPHTHEADVNEYDLLTHQHDDDMEHKYDEQEEHTHDADADAYADADADADADERTQDADEPDDIIPLPRSPSSDSSLGSPISTAVLGLDIAAHMLTSTSTSGMKRKRDPAIKKRAASRYFDPPDVTFKVWDTCMLVHCVHVDGWLVS